MLQILEREIFDSLDSILHKFNIKDEVFAVGVSGGADSLALVYVLSSWAIANNKKIIAITVNHNLRKEGKEEAEYVSKLMKSIGVEHHILEWNGEKPSSGLEEAARVARYSLIEGFCRQRNIKYLITAHHKFDQAETFIMRLQRGSGVDGLSSMSEVSALGSLEVIRPLLNIEPSRLKNYLNKKGIEWKEDYLNYDDEFLRVRVRKALPYLEEVFGISIDRITTTAKILGRTKDYLDKQVNNFIKNNVKFVVPRVVKISFSLLKVQHEEIVFRVIGKIIKNVADRVYIPRAEDIEKIVSSIISDGQEFKGRTLGGCEFINYGGSLWIIPETKIAQPQSKKAWEEFVSDNPKYKGMKLPYKVRNFIRDIEF